MSKSSPKILPMRSIMQDRLEVRTTGRGFFDLTGDLRRLVSRSGLLTGLAHIFVQHTSCSLLITENADPQVHTDLQRFFGRLVPDGDALFGHDAEGPDDMPAHARAALGNVSLTVPIYAGELALGTWQGVYLWEHRVRPYQRNVVLTLTGYGPSNEPHRA